MIEVSGISRETPRSKCAFEGGKDGGEDEDVPTGCS
jgi:hypothetical protein